ncbi:MAG: HAD-IA family hydrolase [Thermoleophilaceae bacterium]
MLVEALRALAAERGWTLDDGDGEALVRAMRSWQPFPDTRPALERARAAGVRLVIVSNTDHDILSHTLRQLEVPFDDVVTAEDCGVYKPLGDRVPAGARAGGRGAGARAARGLRVQVRHPARPAPGHAHRVGEPGRRGPAGRTPNPDFEWRDLWGLAELAGASRG